MFRKKRTLAALFAITIASGAAVVLTPRSGAAAMRQGEPDPCPRTYCQHESVGMCTYAAGWECMLDSQGCIGSIQCGAS